MYIYIYIYIYISYIIAKLAEINSKDKLLKFILNGRLYEHFVTSKTYLEDVYVKLDEGR